MFLLVCTESNGWFIPTVIERRRRRFASQELDAPTASNYCRTKRRRNLCDSLFVWYTWVSLAVVDGSLVRCQSSVFSNDTCTLSHSRQSDRAAGFFPPPTTTTKKERIRNLSNNKRLTRVKSERNIIQLDLSFLYFSRDNSLFTLWCRYDRLSR